MYKLYAIFSLGVLLSACSPKINPDQNKAAQVVTSPEAQTATVKPAFPDAWIGTWVGELGIYRATQKLQSIPMEMVIEAADSVGQYTWTTTYLTKDTIVKPYELQTLDSKSGRYLIDEKNSIKIETFLFDNKLVSWYEVQGTMILASHELRDGQLVFEIIAGRDKPASTTGGTTIDGEEIPPVRTFPITTMQQAVLQRKK